METNNMFKHIAQVLAVNISALTITLSEINGFLTTLSLTLASAYTIYKFFKEFRNRDNSPQKQSDL
jgi:hypothetical protein